MRKTIAKTLAMAALGISMLSSAGCFQAVDGKPRASSSPTPFTLPKPGPRGVFTSSRLVYSADENRPAPEWLLDGARQSLADGGNGLDRLVRRWPDVALELLRKSGAGDADLSLRVAVAKAYDRAFVAADPAAGWAAVLQASQSQPEAYARFRRSREKVLQMFEAGQVAEAQKIDLVALLPSDAPPALRTEALRLAGITALLGEKFDRAASLFEQAARSAAKGPTHPQFEIGLLLCEAQGRRGQTGPAQEAWRSAVYAGASDVHDPELWERAILAKPPASDWPPVVTHAGTAVDPIVAGGTAPDTSDVLINLGMMRLSRRAPQLALLAFSQAETETEIPAKKALARLYRVQSMIELQQAASAIPMLETLAQSSDPRVAGRAQAVLGDVLCRVLGDRQRGMPTLRDGLDYPGAGEWPGKARLSANLALYYLLEGRNEEGLGRLHESQARFEALAQWEDLADDLKNEAAFLRVSGKSAEADAIQRRADDLCRKAGIPVGPLTRDTSRNAMILTAEKLC